MKWSTFQTVFITEQRLLMRRAGFWIHAALLVLVACFIVLSRVQDDHTFDTLVRLINNVTFFQMPLLVWMVAPALLRHTPSARDWFWATYTEHFVVLFAQFVAFYVTVVCSVCIALFPAIIVMFFQGALDFVVLPLFSMYLLCVLPPIIFFELGLIFVIAGITQNILPTVAIVMLLYVLLILGVVLPYATLLNPLNFTLLGLRIEPVVGLSVEKPLLATLLWLYCSLIMSVVILVTSIRLHTEPRQGVRKAHRWLVGLPLLLGLTSSGVAAATYANASADTTVPPPVVEQIQTWRIVHANHIAVVEPGSLEVTAQLHMTHGGTTALESVVLALNPGVRVTHASINGTQVMATREGETIRLQLPTMIAPQDTLRVELTYRGSVQLLREDYTYARGVGNQEEPIRFPRAVRAYLDGQFVMLERDGDWRVWPQNSGPHVAPSNHLEITVIDAPTLLSSGNLVQRQGNKIIYAWNTSIPQFLFAHLPYQSITTAYGTIYVGSFMNQRDQQRAHDLLHLRRAAASLFHEPLSAYEVAVLPYTTDIVVGGALVGMPSLTEYMPRRLTEEEYTDDPRWVQGVFALDLVQGLLTERIAWATRPYTTTGQSLATTTDCTFDAAGNALCQQTMRGGYSPQAPQGRLVAPRLQSIQLQAWSVVLSRLIAGDHLSPEAETEERRLWTVLSEAPSTTNFVARDDARTLLNRRGLLPKLGLNQEAEVRQIALLVVQLYRVQEQQGAAGLIDLLETIAAAYPAGGEAVPDDVLQTFITNALVQKGP